MSKVCEKKAMFDNIQIIVKEMNWRTIINQALEEVIPQICVCLS